jgi:hypothetical protein
VTRLLALLVAGALLAACCCGCGTDSATKPSTWPRLDAGGRGSVTGLFGGGGVSIGGDGEIGGTISVMDDGSSAETWSVEIKITSESMAVDELTGAQAPLSEALGSAESTLPVGPDVTARFHADGDSYVLDELVTHRQPVDPGEPPPEDRNQPLLDGAGRTPEDAVDDYLEALMTRDPKATYAALGPNTVPPYDAWLRDWGSTGTYPLWRVNEVRVVAFDEAFARVSCTYRAGEQYTKVPPPGQWWRIVKNGDRWRVAYLAAQ